MANSCKSAAVLVSYNYRIIRAAYDNGKHVSTDFQIVDDVLNFDFDGKYSGGDNNNDGGGARKKTGKSTFTDLRSGVVTAPALYAARLYPDQLNTFIDSKFKGK